MADRKAEALNVRNKAAKLAASRPHPKHVPNGDEKRYAETLVASFTKGLPHNKNTGVVDSPSSFAKFVQGINTGDPEDFKKVPLGPTYHPRFISGIGKGGDGHASADTRAWESMGAGLTFDLEGPDAQAVTMPPAPKIDSEELLVEITECYWMALLRDVPFVEFSKNGTHAAAVASLNRPDWIVYSKHPERRPKLTPEEIGRLRGPFTRHSLFRGTTPGDDIGPYISQFLLVGTTGIANGNAVTDGQIQYGGMRMDQRVRVATPDRDYMTTWSSWLDVQNGGDMRGRETYDGPKPFRFIATPRDLATYVHFDALYQAYLNACIILLDIGAPFDKNIPFQLDDDVDKQQGFATFGGPHILSLVTEVATRALKAVRFQKYNVHRRLRPEAVGGLIERFKKTGGDETFAPIAYIAKNIDNDLLTRIARHNAEQNAKLSDCGNKRAHDWTLEGDHSAETFLLPMAFPEGSPMHPSYGAGHASVAGACVTILKAFFDHTFELPFSYQTNKDGTKLESVKVNNPLTVEGELNKLCSNISIGRNWAGVHYFSDYLESAKLGEEVAIGLLQEQKLTYGEEFSMTIPKFDGTVVKI